MMLEHQWRLAEIQIANWGTLHGEIYRIPVARKGHLITGPSGSGKSSILDAITAVLIQDRWLRFNAAAQAAGAQADQRTLMSYIRGAWSRTTDDEHDRIVSQYLRPSSTWSGIVLRFEQDTPEVEPVTLARLMFVQGSSTAKDDIKDLCMLERSRVDLSELQEFVRGGLETRKLTRKFPQAVVTTKSHARFYARMCKVLEIPDEALRLLHKTQSAKTLGSLNQLFRDYMLNRPQTFDIAQLAVTQFSELNDAHARVVELRKQRDLLRELRTQSDAYDAARENLDTVRTLNESLGRYLDDTRLDLTEKEVHKHSEALTVLRTRLELAEREAQAAQEEFEAAGRNLALAGGAEIQSIQLQIRERDNQRTQATTNRATLASKLASVDIATVPQTSADFAELQRYITTQLTSQPREKDTPTGATYDENARLAKAQDRVRKLAEEIRSLRMSKSTVPAERVRLRDELCDALGVNPSTLPFAAELIQVRNEFSDWTGAIERVLRPLSLTLLVPTAQLRTVRKWVNEYRVPFRLVFEEIPAEVPEPARAKSVFSLINRIEVTDGHYGDWVRWAVSSRFDVACVDSPDALDDYERAVTKQGQIKTARRRYEKDDRFAIGDKSNWVLGNREEKLEELSRLYTQAGRELDAAQKVIEAAKRAEQEAGRRRGVLESVAREPWSMYDTESIDADIKRLRQRLEEITASSGDLERAKVLEESARQHRDATKAEYDNANYEYRAAETRLDALQADMKRLKARQTSAIHGPLEAEVTEELTTRFRRVKRTLTLENLDETYRAVANALSSDIDRFGQAVKTAESAITRVATQFKERWSATAVNLTTDVADRTGYLEILDTIEAQGLPEHEKKFLDLLHKRSLEQLSDLLSEIQGARAEIQTRVDRINESLLASPFDNRNSADARFLSIELKDHKSETVRAFIDDLQQIVSGSWEKLELAEAEACFERISELMGHLSSSEYTDRSWRERCLDTRQHVAFVAHEIDASGTRYQAYDSGAALSGGQQQKLVVFCLAAALKYQLARPDDDVSTYGTVILDEAFDKADTTYTRMALDVFKAFGFHLVLATPQKLLQAIEPYVGAATAVENPDRQHTVVRSIPWETGGTGSDAGDSAGSGSGGSESAEVVAP